MGQALLACAAEHPVLQIVASVDIGDDLRAALENADPGQNHRRKPVELEP
jgi:hypothetical protein